MISKNATGTTHLADEEESYFVSMTDMMVGMIFIFVILLMTFALSFREAEDKRQEKIDQLTKVQEARTAMLKDIENALKKEGIKVEIDLENGLLHLPEEVLFPSGSATLNPQGRNSLGHLARALNLVVPCYTYISDQESIARSCKSAAIAKLDAIFVEGHTDNVPVGKKTRFADNWELSAQRAIVTFKALIQIEPNLDKLSNLPVVVASPIGTERVDMDDRTKTGKLFSVAGYGEYRPRSSNSSVASRKKNRRIDLRFLMKTPRPKDMDIVEEEITIEVGTSGS